ncbi:TatD family hydrolase [Candidatus Uhrbacteria bacterium]|nr:TatD family hydrolase [Candidatus Uhrbacteria bacterium]
MYYDTHAHLNFNAFASDADAVVARASEAGVRMNVVGSQIDTSRRAVEVAAKHPEMMRAVVGLHPIHLIQTHVDEEEDSVNTRAEIFDSAAYRSLLRSSSLVTGVGECGLDYFRLPDSAVDGTGTMLDRQQIRQLQRTVFAQHVELAIEEKKTLMIHTRQGERARDSITGDGPNAYDDVYTILKNFQFPISNFQLRIIMHCFSGTLEHAKAFLDLGATISFSGIVTFKNAKELHEVVRQTPLERICIETDSPYLAPEPHRGSRNEPAYVVEVAKAIAALKNIPLEQVAEQTTKNALELFQ